MWWVTEPSPKTRMRRAPPEGMKIAITQNKQQRRREKGLSRQEAERSRPVFLYIGLVADKPRELKCERGGPGVATLL